MLADGFAALVCPRDGHDSRRVVEYERDGERREEAPLRLDRGDVRLVGTRVGAAVGWQDGKRFKLAILDHDGNPDDTSTWGKNVRQLCDGAASNEYRFGVGWLESDGRVWFVHGPVGDRTLAFDAVMAADAAATAPSWCGIASAEQNVALLWRDGARLLMNFCTAKKCTTLVVKVPIESKDTLLGYGCVRDACLFATRDKAGTTKLTRVTERGKSIVKTLEHATAETPVAIVGAGQGAFAVSYLAKDGLATIHRVTTELTFTHGWHFNEDGPGKLAYAEGKLFAVFPSGHAHVVDAPR